MIGIILQARMGSSRLPGKILMRLGKQTLIDHIFFRLSFLKHAVKAVLATSVSSNDDVVEKYCIERNISCFRGSELNVLERYYLCAKQYGFKHIVRLTGDNPFPDMEELDRLIDFFYAEQLEYANSFASLPVGVGAEIFTYQALEKCYVHGKQEHHLEHVNEYMIEHPEIFKSNILSTPASKNHPEIRLTIDTPEDYKKACFIIENSKNEYISQKIFMS